MEVVLLNQKIESLKKELRQLPDASRVKVSIGQNNGEAPEMSVHSRAIENVHRFHGMEVDLTSGQIAEMFDKFGIAVARVEKGQDPKKHAATSLDFEAPYSVTLYCVKQGRPECYTIADTITDTCDTLEDV